MTRRSGSETLTRPDRLLLALTSLSMLYERQDGMLSDDDVEGAARRWTTDRMPVEDKGDFEFLADFLWDAAFGPDPDEV